jgi:hypothetical protein
MGLDALAGSLKLYGHKQPEVFYTDNPTADRASLEKLFDGALKKDVVGVEKYAYLDELELPHESIEVLNTEASINEFCMGILAAAQELGTLVVGFDSEWNVDITAGGRLQHHGPTALVQIAYKDRVHLLKVSLRTKLDFNFQ